MKIAVMIEGRIRMDLNWTLQGKEQHVCLMLTLYATECVHVVTVKISIN
jgi:hypothetical protein